MKISPKSPHLTGSFLTLLILVGCVARETDSKNSYSNTTREMKSNVIPDSVFKMTKLKSLVITGMDCDFKQVDDAGNDVTQCWMLHEIPSAIKNLKNLEYLQLNVNAIQSIPREVEYLKKLKVLDLSDNPGLSDIDNVILLENSLEELYLNGCSSLNYSHQLIRFQKLKKLGIAGNHFNEMEIVKIKKALPHCDITF